MIWVAAGVAFTVCLAIVLLLEQNAHRLGLVDHPNQRSSHVVPRPRGGGIGIVIGTVIAVGLLTWTGSSDRVTWVIVAVATGVAALGLADDILSLSPRFRLVVQFVLAGALVGQVGGFDRLPLPRPLDVPLGDVGFVLAVLWFVGVVNFFNFMDGADGLAGGQAVVTLAAVSVMSSAATTALALVLIGAVSAFLVRNWAPARIFLGDVGSGWLGAVLAAIPLSAPAGSRAALAIVVGVSLSLFLIDPAITLLARWARGAPVLNAHREHAYQRLIDPHGSHARTVAGMLATSAVLTTLVMLGPLSTPGWIAAFLGLVAGLVEAALARAAGMSSYMAE